MVLRLREGLAQGQRVAAVCFCFWLFLFLGFDCWKVLQLELLVATTHL